MMRGKPYRVRKLHRVEGGINHGRKFAGWHGMYNTLEEALRWAKFSAPLTWIELRGQTAHRVKDANGRKTFR